MTTYTGAQIAQVCHEANRALQQIRLTAGPCRGNGADPRGDSGSAARKQRSTRRRERRPHVIPAGMRYWSATAPYIESCTYLQRSSVKTANLR